MRRRRRRDEAAAEFRRLVREGSTDTPRLIELARVAGLDEFVRALESGKRVGIKERT